MSFSSVKDKIPNLNTDKLIHMLKNCNNKYFIRGIAVTIILYVIILLYVYTSTQSTLTSIKNTIPSSTTPIKFTKTTIGKNNNNKKQDADIKDLLIDGLYQKTSQGLLPAIRKSDNLTSFRAYQHPFNFEGINIKDKPVITFVVQDYGLSQEQSKTALDTLPPEVSLILNPYVNLPNEWIKMAQTKGHEVWLGLPIQNNTLQDNGKNTVFHHISLPEKIAALYKIMTKTQGYMGLASFTDQQINSVPEHYTQLINKIYERGLGFLELNPNSAKLLEGGAFNLGAPYIKANTKIITVKGEQQSFEKMEQLAKENGHVVTVIPSYPKTLKNLAIWIEKVGNTDYTIAPVSSIYDLPFYEGYQANNNTPPPKLKSQDHEEPESYDTHKNH